MTYDGWKNKKGTGERSCKCRTWKQHWLNASKREWPEKCSRKGCDEKPTLGAHIYNAKEKGEKIVPFCDSCNKLESEFDLKKGTFFVPANRQETCEK